MTLVSMTILREPLVALVARGTATLHPPWKPRFNSRLRAHSILREAAPLWPLHDNKGRKYTKKIKEPQDSAFSIIFGGA
jgi:hypothetical protein